MISAQVFSHYDIMIAQRDDSEIQDEFFAAFDFV